MFDKLKSILSKLDADYADIRYEVKKDTIVSFSGKELTEIGANSADGFVIRALKDGGMASVVFTKASDAEKALRSVIENARLMAKNSVKPIRLTEVDLVQDAFIPALKEDPRDVSMSEKLELVRKYNQIPLGHKKVATTSITYQDVIRE